MRRFAFIRLLIAATMAVALPAQNLLPTNVFPTVSYFRERFATPSTEVQLAPIVRIEDFVITGKLELSLRNYLDLVMVNNPAVAIQKLNIRFPENAITRAYSIFDPTISFTYLPIRSNNPPTSVLQGAQGNLSSLSHPFNINYAQPLASGAVMNLGYTSNRQSTNNAFTTFNPSFNTGLAFGITQPLLRGFGSYITKVPIMLARGRYRISESQLMDQILRIVNLAELAYWDAIQARESLAVQEQSLRLREEALKRAQRELELGALSPLDIYQPQAEYASAEVLVTQARFLLERRLDAVRRQIGADLDPDTRELPIVLTEPVLPPTDTTVYDREPLVEMALRIRPDLEANRLTLGLDDLRIQQATNSLRPDLNVTLGYSSAGRGGTFIPRDSGLDPSAPLAASIPGGLGDALSQMFGFNFPTYSMGVRFNFPIRDRRAAADLADALVTKKQDSYQVRSLEQQVRLEVLNAINDVESAKASVQQAIIARDFAQKRVEAEQKKYELGTTVLFFVLDAQTQLIRAENEVVNQSIAYRRAMVNLLRVTGQLLDERGIQVSLN